MCAALAREENIKRPSVDPCCSEVELRRKKYSFSAGRQ
jgi:hypothetical protein